MPGTPVDFARLKAAKLALLCAVRDRVAMELRGSSRERLLAEIDAAFDGIEALRFRPEAMHAAFVPLQQALLDDEQQVYAWVDSRICAVEDLHFSPLGAFYEFVDAKIAESPGADFGSRHRGPDQEDLRRKEERKRLGRRDTPPRVPRPAAEASFQFHGELFELRNEVVELLRFRGFTWFVDYTSVDLLHDCFGIEVGGIADRDRADAILRLLQDRFRSWHFRDWWCKDVKEVEPGWVVVLHRDPEPEAPRLAP